MTNLNFSRPKGFIQGLPSGTFLSTTIAVASFGLGSLFVHMGEIIGALFLAAPFIFAVVWNHIVNGFRLGRARHLRLSLAETSALAYALAFAWERSGTFRVMVIAALLSLIALGAGQIWVGGQDSAAVQSNEAYETSGKRPRSMRAPEDGKSPKLPVGAPIASTNSRA